MEPTLSQIKEYIREKDINIFEVLNIDTNNERISLLYENDNDAYFQYYLNHSTEIIEWLSKELNGEERSIRF